MNNPISCIIIHDEPLAINVLVEYAKRIPQLKVVATASNAINAYETISTNKIDLLFIDIEMPDLNGIEFVKSLSSPPHIILTTAYRDYAPESYEIKAIDYLLKPISFQHFFKAFTKCQDTINRPTTLSATIDKIENKHNFIYVYADKKNIKVLLENILYIESIKDYVRISTTEGNLISKSTLSNYESLLPTTFVRVHRSYIVNTNKITAYTNHDIEIEKKRNPH